MEDISFSLNVGDHTIKFVLQAIFAVIALYFLLRREKKVASWAAQGFRPMSAGDIQIGDWVLLSKSLVQTVPVLVQTIDVIQQKGDFSLLRFNGQYSYWSHTSMRAKRSINAEPA